MFTSVHVYNDSKDYGLYGVIDCLECIESDKGVAVGNDSKLYRLCIVEYKPTKPLNGEHREEDIMQVFAQKLCVDYVFKCDCEAVIYYADVKKRFKISLKDNYDTYDRKLKALLGEMRENLEKGYIPPIRKGQKCSGCSMKDLCMPSLKIRKNFREYLENVKYD